MPPANPPPKTVHASCVAVGASAVLILGASGSGKSALALNLMALGAVLVADDKTILTSTDAGVMATCPKAITGQIEARGVGILLADAQRCALLRLVVDLDQKQPDRLPPPREVDLLNHKIPLFYTPVGPHFAAAILQMLKGGRIG